MLFSCGVGEDSWESLGLQGDKSVNSKGNQSWIFIGRTDAEGEAPTLWPPDAKNWLIRKDPHAGKDWRQEKGMKQDEMVGCHHWFSACEFEQTPGNSEGQESLAPWGCKESDTSEWLNNNGGNPTKTKRTLFVRVCVCVCVSFYAVLRSCGVGWSWGSERGDDHRKLNDNILEFTCDIN